MSYQNSKRSSAAGRKVAARLFGVGLVSALLAGALPAQAGFELPPPPISIVAVEPVEGGALVFETVAAASSDDEPRYLVNLDLWLQNQGSVMHRLERVRFQFYFERFLSVPLTKDADLEITPGQRRKLIMPFERDIFAPPVRLRVELFFERFPTPVERSFDLVPYESPWPGPVIVPPGSEGPRRAHHYPFPGRAGDLRTGEFWATGQNHQLGSKHRKNPSQRFAYDFGVIGWDAVEGVWSRKFPGVSGDRNDHYRIWGKPVYALSTGVILWCEREEPDNPFPPDILPNGLGGGNQIAILQENGEMIYYAHFMERQIPEEVCQPGSKIEEGTFLGLVGNSGNSTGPHLHLHLENRQDQGGGRPLLFSGVHGVRRALLNPDDPVAPWAFIDNQAFGPGIAIFPSELPPR